jgi:hypothetical protein
MKRFPTPALNIASPLSDDMPKTADYSLARAVPGAGKANVSRMYITTYEVFRYLKHPMSKNVT